MEENKNNYKVLKGVFISVTVIGIIILVIFFVVGFAKQKAQITGNSNLTFKEAPTITTDFTLTGILLNIYCNSNYSLVEITVELHDKNDIAFQSYTLQGRNYKKGNTYQLEKTLSVTELFKAETFSYKVTRYY